jgi:hypothetical protein
MPMAQAKIIEVSHLSGGVLVTFSDGKVTFLNPTILYAFAVDPLSLPQFFTADGADKNK